MTALGISASDSNPLPSIRSPSSSTATLQRISRMNTDSRGKNRIRSIPFIRSESVNPCPHSVSRPISPPLTPGGGISKFPVRVGGRRSMVDPQIVVLVVAGSSPVGHPTLPFFAALELKGKNHATLTGRPIGRAAQWNRCRTSSTVMNSHRAESELGIFGVGKSPMSAVHPTNLPWSSKA